MANVSRAAAVVAAALALAGCEPRRAAAPSPSPSVGRPATLRFEVADADDAFDVGVTLRSRLVTYGAGPGAPTVAGRTITIEVERDVVRGDLLVLAGRGGLAFRGVVEAFPPGECAEPGTRRTLLTRAAAAPDPTRVVTCAENGEARYELGPAEPVGKTLGAKAVESSPPTAPRTWTVSMRLRPEPWAEVTGRYVGRKIAIVLDGAVWSAPTILEPITDGAVELSGSFDERRARLLAALASSGDIDVPVKVLP
jgi:preprotein translocase subunit SecD